MTEKVYPLPYVMTAVQGGLSASEGLRQFRAGGGKIRDAVWFKLFSETKSTIAERGNAVTGNLDAIPDRGEIKQFTTVTGTGYLQQVEVRYRLKGDDQVYSRPFSLTGNDLITKQEAIEEALSVYGAAVADGRYEEQVLLDAVYVGTYSMQPTDLYS